MSHHIPGNWGRASKSTQISRNCARWFLNWQDILWRRAFCLKRAWENMKCSNWWAFLLLFFLWWFTSVLTSSQSLGLMGSCLNQQSEQWHSSWLLHVVKTETYSMESQSCGKVAAVSEIHHKMQNHSSMRTPLMGRMASHLFEGSPTIQIELDRSLWI